MTSPAMTRTYARIAPRRSGTVRTNWARGWQAAVEESAYEDRELKKGRALARAGAVGRIEVAEGSLTAAVGEGDETYSLRVEVPVLDADGIQTLIEVVGSGAGWIGQLLGGGLPASFVEATEEAGIELVPYGGEFSAVCACEAWAQPCRHALAVLTQVGWLVEAEPLTLIHVRGVARPELLDAVAQASGERGGEAGGENDSRDAGEDPEDLEIAVEAAERAAAMLEVGGS